MKCESCGSSWESRQHLDKCPFCGSLLNKSLDLDSNFSNTLKMVLNQYGVEILKEKKFISILKDYVPNETKKNELMNIFVTKDVGRKFVEMYFEKNSEWVNIYDYCVKCLTEDAFIGHEFACMVMDEIGEALNLTHQTQAYILDKNNKSYSAPDKKEIGRFLLDEKTKYESIVKQAKNKEPQIKTDKEIKQKQTVREHFYGTEETPICHFEIENGVLKKYNGKATQIVIPKSVTEIGDGAFFGNEQLSSVQYRPAQIKRIGVAAFFGCTNLSEINGFIGLWFGEGLEEIGGFAFQNCRSITSVSIPNSTKLIDGRAFYNCDNLKSIIFDGNQVVIKSDAFKKCKNLRNIEIDEKLFAKYCDCFDGEWNKII